MKKLFQLAFLLLFIASYCVYLNRYSFTVANGDLMLGGSEKYYDYKGITNVHSDLSTGSGTQAEIIKYAQEQKMDFLFFTEVNNYNRTAAMEGYYNSMLVLQGAVYSYLDSRVIYYNAPANQPPEGKGQAQVYFTDLLTQYPRSSETGLVVIAHPLHSRYPWSGEYPIGVDGIEVINLKRVLEVAWKESKFNSVWSILTYPLNPYLSLLRVYRNPKSELELWDKLNQKRKVIGLMGTDATAKTIISPNVYFHFPSYSTAFSVASNHVLLRSELTGESASDKQKLLTAIQSGQFYFSLDILGNPKGFWTEVSSGSKSYPIGSEIKLANNTEIKVHLPSQPQVPFEVQIFKDGELFATSTATETTLRLFSAGIYRIVVRIFVTMPFPEGKKWIPWIYANPFYLVN